MSRSLDNYTLIVCPNCGNNDTAIVKRGSESFIICSKCHRIIIAARDCFSTDGQTYQRNIAGRLK
jgi:ribosomal protein L37AE/L43A